MDRITVETRDLDEAVEILRAQYTAKVGPPGSGGGLRLVQDALGAVFLSRAEYFMEAEVTVDEPMSHTYVTRLRGGQLRYDMGPTPQLGRQDTAWVPGDVFVTVTAGGTFDAALRNSDVEFAAIDPATFAAVAQSGNGRPVGLTGYAPVSADAARSWTTAFDFARQVATDPAVTPLVAASTGRLLAATALAVFPNNASTDPTIGDRRDAHPATVRRAVAFIETHPDLDLSVVDIAKAAFVTPRALQLAFRKHLDTTPMRYLRRVRLNLAHDDLQAADPAVETVTAVGARWGWASPSRFAADYRSAYGRHPRETLRS